MEPVIIYSSELAPIIARARSPWANFTLAERLAAVRTVLRRRGTPESLKRLRLMEFGIPMAMAFNVIEG